MVYVSNTDIQHWSDGVIRFLNTIKDDSFVLLHEDFYLTQPVDKHGIENLWKHHHAFDRVSLLGNHTPSRTEKWNEFFVHRHEGEYQFSFEASIQNKHFLLENLKPGLDPWESERVMAKVAKGKVLSSEHPVIWYEDKSRRLEIK